ncbi:MAG: ABC transporter ATP-binding protein, partial [Candidatus Dormibacteraeota bacterium]|nr:ABC transporter ATP-binding protein [Candidatus Dormibacteraeota bacterium]
MSEQRPATPPPTLAAANRPPARQFGGGPFGGMGMAEKPLDFRSSLGRMAARLRREKARLAGVLVLGVTSVALMVIGPKILG